jgi:hypothetical protein
VMHVSCLQWGQVSQTYLLLLVCAAKGELVDIWGILNRKKDT